MIETFKEVWIAWLSPIPKELAVLVTAAMPVLELRGAIPLGVKYYKMTLGQVLPLAILGNLIPVAPIIILLEPVSNKLRNVGIFKKFFDWLFERTRRKAKLVERYEFLGLILFVSIPLPMTGAWTGAIAASLFKMKFKLAVLAIVAGVLLASFLVSLMMVSIQGVVIAVLLIVLVTLFAGYKCRDVEK